jgi:hypothetical protein
MVCGGLWICSQRGFVNEDKFYVRKRETSTFAVFNRQRGFFHQVTSSQVIKANLNHWNETVKRVFMTDFIGKASLFYGALYPGGLISDRSHPLCGFNTQKKAVYGDLLWAFDESFSFEWLT